MEKLADIELWDRWGVTVSAEQLVLIGLVIVGLLVVLWLVNGKLLPWYYSREATTAKNMKRIKRVISLLAFSVLLVEVLRILNIDSQLFSFEAQPSATDDGPPVDVTMRISTIVTGLVAFVVANVFDLVIGEILVQRLYASREAGNTSITASNEKQLIRRFGAVRPIMYILATIVTVEATGLAQLYLRFPLDVRKELKWMITLERVLFIVLLFFVLRLVFVFFTTFVLQRYYSRSKIDIGSQFAINRLLTYFGYVVGILLILQMADFNLFAIWTGAAALLVGIGIGLQQTFNDLICGVIILFERSVKVGDIVELTGHQVGTIRKIGTRTSIIETRDDIMVYVPNSKLIGENVTNWSQVDRRARFHVQVGVAYGTDPALVREVLLRVAAEHDRVLDSPATIVRLLNFGDSSLDFDLLFWSRDLVRIEDVKSDLRFAIDAAFRKAGIEVPFPQRDLWIRSVPAGLAGKTEEE